MHHIRFILPLVMLAFLVGCIPANRVYGPEALDRITTFFDSQGSPTKSIRERKVTGGSYEGQGLPDSEFGGINYDTDSMQAGPGNQKTKAAPRKTGGGFIILYGVAGVIALLGALNYLLTKKMLDSAALVALGFAFAAALFFSETYPWAMGAFLGVVVLVGGMLLWKYYQATETEKTAPLLAEAVEKSPDAEQIKANVMSLAGQAKNKVKDTVTRWKRARRL